MNRLWLALLPELRSVPAPDQGPALDAARRTPLDALELAAMALGFVAVTAVTRYSLPDAAMATRIGAMLANVAVALPLLALALGPFHVRRLRRGLRERLATRRRAS